MLEAIKNPTPATLGLLTVLIVIPFFWPVTMYAWLRFLTGHRRSNAKAAGPNWAAGWNDK
jgi:hypothetical protein